MLLKADEKDRQMIMDYCLTEPCINLFIIGDIESFGVSCDFLDVWTQWIDGKLTGIVLRYYDNFVIYSRDLDMDFKEVNDFLKTKTVKVINGKRSVIDLLYPLMEDKYPRREMYFCELLDTSKLLEDTEDVVKASLEDAEEITSCYMLIEEFSEMYSSRTEHLYKQIVNRIETGTGVHMIVRKDGKIVSHGNTTAETTVSGMIGGILTLPEYRNKGYASRVVSAICMDLKSRGKMACLFFDNPKAGSIYHRLGFKDIDQWVVLSPR